MALTSFTARFRAHPDRAALGILLLLSSLVYVRIFPAFASAIPGDANLDGLHAFWPFYEFVHSQWRAGSIPLWNPYIFCGHPIHAEGQAAIFYPVNLLLAFIPTVAAMNLFAWAHLFAAGAFMHAWLRAAKLGPAAAFLGAAAYMLGTAPLSRLYAGHYAMIPYLALVPAYLWCWENWRSRDAKGVRSRWWAGMALVVGAMALAGHPQSFYYSFYYFAFLAFAEVIVRWRAGKTATPPSDVEVAGGSEPEMAHSFGTRSRSSHWRPIFVLAAAYAIGAAIGAIQLWPTLDFGQYSFRQGANIEFAGSFSFPPENLITLLAPTFFGKLHTGVYWGRAYLWEMWIYIGVIPLGLALMAAIRGRTAWTAIHAVGFVLFVILALGRHTPLFAVLYKFAPFFSYFRGASKFGLFALISLIALSAAGMERLLAAPTPAARKSDATALARIFAVIFTTALVAFLMLQGEDKGDYVARMQEEAALQADPPVAAFRNVGGSFQSLLAWRLQKGETMGPYTPEALPPIGQTKPFVIESLLKLLLASALGVSVATMLRRENADIKFLLAALLILSVADLLHLTMPAMKPATIASVTIPPEFQAAIRETEGGARALSIGALNNGYMPARVNTPLGYAGILSARYNDYLTLALGVPRETSMAAQILGDRLPGAILYPHVGYVAMPARMAPGSGAELAATAGGARLYRLSATAPRIYFSPIGQIVRDRDEAYGTASFQPDPSRKHDTLERPSAVGDPRSILPETAAPPTADDRVTLVAETPTRIEISAEVVGEVPRFLILTDAYDPGWRCEIDGAPAEILPANIAFRAVTVPAGKHTIVFHYVPRAFYIGAATSLASVLALAVVLLVRRPKRITDIPVCD